jgi:hypothetical protein
MGELIQIEFRPLPADHRKRRGGPVVRGRLRSIAQARTTRATDGPVEYLISRAELDTVRLECALIKSVSGRRASAEQVANNLALDLDDVVYAMHLLAIEAHSILGPLHTLLEHGYDFSDQ